MVIPLPRFTGDFTIPSRYAVPATYYLDVVNGRDGYDGRSPDLPWQTIQRIHDTKTIIKPGDTVLFRRGQTWSGLRLAMTRHGAEGNPITFGAWGEGDRPVIDTAGAANAAENYGYNHLRFESLHFANGLQFGLYNKTADDVWLTDCEASYAGNDGVLFLTGCTRCRVYGGRFHHSYDRTNSGNVAITGIEIADGGADFLVDGAEVDHNYSGITAHGHPTSDVPQQVVWKNISSHDNSINGMQTASGSDTGTQTIDLTIVSSTVVNNGQDGLSIGSSGATAVSGLVTLRGCTISGNTRYQISKDLASGVTVDQDTAIPITVIRP